MKLIIAIVRPFTLEKIVTAFEQIEDFPGMTVTDSEGFGRGLGNESDPVDPFQSSRRIEVVANDDLIDTIVAAIASNAHTGKRGDGIIAVIPINGAFSI